MPEGQSFPYSSLTYRARAVSENVQLAAFFVYVKMGNVWEMFGKTPALV